MAGQSTCALKSIDSYAKKVADRDQRGISKKTVIHFKLLKLRS